MGKSISLAKRSITAYLIIGKTFGLWLSTLFTGMLIALLRLSTIIFLKIDKLFYPSLINKKVQAPVLIVGNPRSGTTFLHRFLIKNKIGQGSELWQMLYPSLIQQKFMKPFLPLLEKISPTRHHSTEAHKTSLSSIETDDASMLFRYFDGFFLYGFILSWSKDDLFDWVDPKIRNTSDRDCAYFNERWIRVLRASNDTQFIGKLFSVSADIPSFLKKFPDAKLLYMLRDPLSVIPSGLSLVTGVQDKRFGFWSLEREKRQHFIDRLYKGLIELQLRFHDDWVNGRIDPQRVMIVNFDDMMQDFGELMNKIMVFLGKDITPELQSEINLTSAKQREFKSGHKYNLEKFGLTEEKIKKDCKPIYETFFKS
ncbi:MAG: hypothetical protein CBD58_04805 [bacterium TMED198]|nr:MAG: hypothetical protein CBD58_04805 [bacterium TMED198]